MTLYHVHLYREMRLAFGSIEADSPEQAPEIAHAKATDEADSIEDCDGETFAALVDVAGDEDYRHSRVIDFAADATEASSSRARHSRDD